MQLPFTKKQVFDLFAAYNAGLWPALIALWIASVLSSVLLLSSRRPPDRWIGALLAAHWAWSAPAPARGHCPGDLLDAEEQRQLGIAKRVESAAAGDTDMSENRGAA